MDSITQHDIEIFTNGACFLLAKVVMEETGWPVAAFWDGFRPRHHVFNVLPDGRYLDVEGPRTRQEFIANHVVRHRRITTQNVQLNDWELPWSWSDYDLDYYIARAQEILPALLATVNV
jgi:hypothetical protein